MPSSEAASSTDSPTKKRIFTTSAQVWFSSASCSIASLTAKRSCGSVSDGSPDLVQVDPLWLAAPLQPSFVACAIDENSPHRLGSRRKEVCPTVPILCVFVYRPAGCMPHGPTLSLARSAPDSPATFLLRPICGAPHRQAATAFRQLGRRHPQSQKGFE